MTLEEAKRLQSCVQEIAAILESNTQPDKFVSLEIIEKVVRQQILEQISPQVV